MTHLLIMLSVPILLILSGIKIYIKGNPKDTIFQVIIFYLGALFIQILITLTL